MQNIIRISGVPMKTKKIISAAVILIFSLFSSGAYASSWEDFTDISGHWAEATVKKGFEDGLITGLDDTTVAPDTPITAAQMITVLCRVLGAMEKADISSLGISPDVWYADAAGKALKLGLISAETGSLDVSMTRQDALAMMAKAFCLVPAEPNYAVLDSFSDASKISGKNRGAIAALVSENLIQGYDGALNVSGSITRAEFLTVLYRVAESYTTAGSLVSGISGGCVLKGSGSLSYINAGNIWFDCSAESVSLTGVKADTVTLRSHTLTNFWLGGGSDISCLVVAVGKGSASLGGGISSEIGRLRLESCTSMSVGSGVDTVEITGSGMSVSISGSHDYLVITGSGNTVTLLSGASLSRLKITGTNNTVKPADGAANAVSCGEVEVSGNGNIISSGSSACENGKITAGGTSNTLDLSYKSIAALTVSGTKAEVKISSLAGISEFSVSGNENDIEAVGNAGFSLAVGGSLNEIALKSDGKISALEVTGNSNWLSASCSELASAGISGSYNTVNKLDPGEVGSLNIPGLNNAFILPQKNELTQAEIKGSYNIVTVNGTAGTITLSGRKNTLGGTGKVTNLNINASGCTVSLAADRVTDNSNQAEIDRVLKLVTTGYTGNYTLKWAQEHDYEEFEKEIWINAKEYSSNTDYLIWVNLSMQRVNIFKGSKGNWDLVYSCIVGTGAPGRGTPVGVWKTTYKTWEGWTTSTYTVKPVVGFKDNTGYAFHSRLYRPGTTTVSDASIGFPVSHGCVRMYDQDILYIYNNIPLGTTVVVY